MFHLTNKSRRAHCRSVQQTEGRETVGNRQKIMKIIVVFYLLAFVMASHAQGREATEMDEAEEANIPELSVPEFDEMVEDSLLDKAASGEFATELTQLQP